MIWTLVGLLWAAQPNLSDVPDSETLTVIEESRHPKVQRVVNRSTRRIQWRRLMGSVVLVSYKGELIYLDTRGWQNKKERTKMSVDTIFRMYSLSKPVTSVAVLQLVEQGKVELDAPIGTYISELASLKVYGALGYTEPERTPRVSDLLRHTSGFSYGIFGIGPVDALYNLNHPLMAETSTEFVERLAELPLAFDPGTQWRYGVSTDVLGVLIERVTGQSLGEYLSSAIFEPLGMMDTGFVVSEDQVERFGPMYTRFGVELEPVNGSPFLEPRFESGGGGLVSTLSDYNRFAQMLMADGTFNGHQILSPDSVRLMQENQLPSGVRSINGDGFGHGFQVQVEPNRQSPSGEYTWDGIGSTHFWASPEHDLYVIALAQYMPFVPVLKYSLRPRIYKALDIEWER